MPSSSSILIDHGAEGTGVDKGPDQLDCLGPLAADLPADIDHVVIQGHDTLRYLSPFHGVFLTVGDHRKETRFNPTVIGRGMVTLLFLLVGDTEFVDEAGRKWSIGADTLGVMYRPQDSSYQVVLREDADVVTLGLHLTPEAMAQQPFRAALEGLHEEIISAPERGACLLGTMPLTPTVRSLALSLAFCSRENPGRPLEASIRTLELISAVGSFTRMDRPLPGAEYPTRDQVGRLVTAKRLIDTNYSDGLTLTQLAACASMSETRFRFGFQRLFGRTPMAYLTDVRIERAKALLRDSDASIGQISWAVGYTHQCNFTAAFKRETGQSPKLFRRQFLARQIADGTANNFAGIA